MKSTASILLVFSLFLFHARSAFSAPRGVPDPPASPSAVHDQALREGWKLLAAEEYGLSREKLRKVPTDGYLLADYVVAFTGLSFVREGRLAEAASAYDNLVAAHPQSPLAPYLAVELAYRAALVDNLALARPWFDAARGKVSGPERRSEENHLAARFEEEVDPVRAAELHLTNFVSYSAQDAGARSAERLASWHREGKFSAWGLQAPFYGRFAKALFRAGDADRARMLYREALRKFPVSADTAPLLYDFAEMLRKQGDTRGSRALLEQAIAASPAGPCGDASFLQARVSWKAGDLAGARAAFVAIAENGACLPPVAERALHLAAWIAEEEGDLPWLTETFGRLRSAGDDAIRTESVFRHAFGLYRMGLYDNAAAAFEAGAAAGGSVERARHRYWRARSLEGLGRAEDSAEAFRKLSAEAGAGIYALFAARHLGRDPYAMFDAPSSLETRSCAGERASLWEKVLGAAWEEPDATKLARSERLSRLGMLEYAILEADRIERGKVRRAVGIPEAGTAGFFRYLAGDLRGALRDADRLPTDLEGAGLLERIQFPLAPELVGDCDRKRSGMDPLVLHSVIRQESQFSPTIMSPAGAVGLMQLMPRTAAETARRSGQPKPRRRDLVNPQANVELGAAYLSMLVRRFDGDYMRAVAAYNAGETPVTRWWARGGGDPAAFLESISYRETRGYVRRVFFNLLQYYRIYRPQMFSRYFPNVPTEGAPATGAPGTPPSGAIRGDEPATTGNAPGG